MANAMARSGCGHGRSDTLWVHGRATTEVPCSEVVADRRAGSTDSRLPGCGMVDGSSDPRSCSRAYCRLVYAHQGPVRHIAFRPLLESPASR